MTTHYKNTPKKKRVYIDSDGNMYGLGKGDFDQVETRVFTSSGTMDANGTILVTGTMVRADSVVMATYIRGSDPTVPLYFHVTTASGTGGVLQIKGDASRDLSYMIVN